MLALILTLVVIALIALALRYLGAGPVWTKVFAILGIAIVIVWLLVSLGALNGGKLTL